MRTWVFHILTVLSFWNGTASLAHVAKVSLSFNWTMGVAVVTGTTHQIVGLEWNQSSNQMKIEESHLTVSELDSKPKLVKKVIAKKKFLNFEDYPEIIASNIHGKSDGSCSGFIEIKGMKRPVRECAWFPSESKILIQTSVSLSDYGISNHEMFMKVDDAISIFIEAEP